MNRAERRKKAARARQRARQREHPVVIGPSAMEAPTPAPNAPSPEYLARTTPEERLAHAREHLDHAAAHVKADWDFLVEVADLWDTDALPPSYASGVANMDAAELEAHIADVSRSGHALIAQVKERLGQDLHDWLIALNEGLHALRLYPDAGTLWNLIEENGWGDDFGELAEHWLPQWEPPPT